MVTQERNKENHTKEDRKLRLTRKEYSREYQRSIRKKWREEGKFVRNIVLSQKAIEDMETLCMEMTVSREELFENLIELGKIELRKYKIISKLT